MPNQTLLTFCAAAAFGLAVSSAEAAEIKVFVGGAMTETVEKIGADFARSSGNTLTYVSDTTGALLNRLKNGEKADVLVVTAPAMDGLEKDKGVVQGSRGPTSLRPTRSRPRSCRHARFPMSIPRPAEHRARISKAWWARWASRRR